MLDSVLMRHVTPQPFGPQFRARQLGSPTIDHSNRMPANELTYLIFASGQGAGREDINSDIVTLSLHLWN